MPTYKVTMFIMGCGINTKEVEYVTAPNEEEAEKDALWHRDGYGIYSTTEMDSDYPSFSVQQVSVIKHRLHDHLTFIMSDFFEREKVVDALLPIVLEDIEECADWSDLDDNEICDSDVDSALARALYTSFVNDV